MKFNTTKSKVTMSFKMSQSFRDEIARIAEAEGVKSSNVVMTFMIEGYKKYSEEHRTTVANHEETKDLI